MNRVLVAVSGGVDSSAAVLLLQKAGWETGGVVMKMSPLHQAAVDAAREAARKLDIPLAVLDLQREFRERVIENFVTEYMRGRTPNPCVRCNVLLKFAGLLETAARLGYNAIATGHYARVERDGDFLIRRAASRTRDQSYMLYRLPREVRQKLMFPLGELEKNEVREMAGAAGLPNHSAPDSQENCFLPDKNYVEYIKARAGEQPGEIISPDGIICGRHNGLYHFTVGQRKGFGSLGKPAFVKSLDPLTNRVYLGWGGEEFSERAVVEDCVWHTTLAEPFRCCVKVRSAAPLAEVRVFPSGDRAELFFDTPQRAVTPGQSAVFYEGDCVIGGGIFV